MKSADEVKSNDATAALDADLFINVLAGETWIFKATIFASEAAANPNIKIGLGGTATVSAGNIRYNVSDFSGNSGTGSTFNSTVTGINTTSTVMAAVINGSATFATAGTAGVYWAQSSANANAVTVYKMSFMKATRAATLSLGEPGIAAKAATRSPAASSEQPMETIKEDEFEVLGAESSSEEEEVVIKRKKSKKLAKKS